MLFTPCRHLALPAMAYLGLLCCAGCGEPNQLGRRGVSGSVKFAGLPLESGVIQFDPVDPAGVTSGTAIRQGAFSLPAAQGVPPGKYIVRVYSANENEAREPAFPGDPFPPAKERIPKQYNLESQEIFEVPATGTATLQLDLK